MISNEFQPLWQYLDQLHQTVAEMIEVQRKTVEVVRQLEIEASDSEHSELSIEQVVAQLDKLREQVDQQRQEASRAATGMETVQPPRMKEVSVERLNVVEPDGTVRLVLCNPQRSPGHVMDGEVFGEPEGKRWAGIYFFNDEGNECGGLVYSGKREADGSYSAGGGFFFDQYRQDQVTGIRHGDTDGRRLAGFQVWDRPDMPIDEWVERYIPILNLPAGPEKEAALQELRAAGLLETTRVFVGKTPDKSAVIRLHDAQSRVRLRLVVEAEGAPALEFLDEEGHVVSRLPDG